uniref:Uncharacterized protein n=1 Tax=Strigamia maritima TaxID=126957 RepID=T1J0X3_STRMM
MYTESTRGAYAEKPTFISTEIGLHRCGSRATAGGIKFPGFPSKFNLLDFCSKRVPVNTEGLLDLTTVRSRSTTASPSPSVLLAHTQAIAQKNAVYPIRRTEVKTFTIPTGYRNANIDQAYIGQFSSCLILGLVSNESYNGSYKKNPFDFKHYDCAYPATPLTPNFSGGSVAREFVQLYSAMNRADKEVGLNISYTDYMYGGYTLFAFDLTQDGSASKSHFNLVKQGTLRVELRFKNALPETVSLLIFAEFQSLIKIDKNCNVISEF